MVHCIESLLYSLHVAAVVIQCTWCMWVSFSFVSLTFSCSYYLFLVWQGLYWGGIESTGTSLPHQLLQMSRYTIEFYNNYTCTCTVVMVIGVVYWTMCHYSIPDSVQYTCCTTPVGVYAFYCQLELYIPLPSHSQYVYEWLWGWVDMEWVEWTTPLPQRIHYTSTYTCTCSYCV